MEAEGRVRETPSCCPVGSLPYLAATYAAKGEVVKLDAVELYHAPVSGQPKSGILICPDVWGWNGGRVRAIADGLAEQGYNVVVGKFLSTPALNGGTDGDALPPDGEFDLEWIKNFPWEKQKPKVEAALGYLKAAGCEKIGVMGFCYGGHPCCWASATDPTVKCGVVCHPSIQLEGVFGGDTVKLLESVKCPFLLAPAGNDLPMWAEESEFGQAIRRSDDGHNEITFVYYFEQKHGWSCRGDLQDEAVKRDVESVMGHAVSFFNKHLL